MLLGIVNKILSFPIWIPLSNLTYDAYLLNPLIIHWLGLFKNYPMVFEIVNAVSFNSVLTLKL